MNRKFLIKEIIKVSERSESFRRRLLNLIQDRTPVLSMEKLESILQDKSDEEIVQILNKVKIDEEIYETILDRMTPIP